jgi:hypothetical protein
VESIPGDTARRSRTPSNPGQRVTDLPFEFDEIGYWSELKLEIVEKYGSAYTRTFANFPNLKKYYIEGFSGAGVHVSKTTGDPVDGGLSRCPRLINIWVLRNHPAEFRLPSCAGVGAAGGWLRRDGGCHGR